MKATPAPGVSRRDFLRASGLLVGFTLAPRLALGQDRPAPLPGSLNTNRMLDAWLRIDPNGAVTIFTGKIELGQGIGTALAQIAADELDVHLKRIEMIHGDTARTPDEGQTAGSLSVEQSGTALRFACAEARDILVSTGAAVLRRLGVVAVVRDGSFLAVAAEREEQAIGAREALARSARWGETASLPPSGEALYRQLMSSPAPGETVVEKTAPVASATKTLEALYTRPYQCHGSIGPSCAVAQWEGQKLTVWTHSQGVFPLRADLAKVFGLKPQDIRCIHAEGSGCYGHNGADDVALDAALVARATGGRPVKLQWMRDDEFMWAPYGSAMAMKLSGGIDAQGNVVAWSHEVWSHPHSTRPGSSSGINLLAARHLARPSAPVLPADVPQPAGGSDRNAIPLYDFGNVKVVKHYVAEAPLRTSALRTLGGYANVFALESFVDELATAAGADPVECRLRHLKDPRARAVIEAVARRAAWQPGAKAERGHGRGVAFARYKN